MDRAITHHFNKDIKEKIKLPYGWKQTWLLTLSDNQKVVFRSHAIRCNAPQNELKEANKIMTEIYNRESFFYKSVNTKLGHICPEIYIVDDTCKYYANSYQISEYIEGENLSSYIEKTFDENIKKDIYYKIGEVTANINQIEIDTNHPYVTGRNSWEDYFANKIYDKLSPLVKHNFITTDEINKICENMRGKKATHTLSFTHLDIRPHNMIYNNGNIFVLDAEECEFGDPLYELASIEIQWTYWEMYDYLLKGYKSVLDIDLDNDLYYYYKLVILGSILDMHFNRDCANETTQSFLNTFGEVKEKLLRSE